MSGNILVTGADGTIGWPVCMRLALKYPDKEIIGIDTEDRRRWVNECGSVSAIPVPPMKYRLSVFSDTFEQNNIVYFTDNIRSDDFIRHILKRYNISTIVHLAAQPSAPFSMKYPKFTLSNNNNGTLSLIMAIKEVNPEIKLIETTTMGIYGTPEWDIYEDEIGTPNYRLSIPSQLPPFTGGSWYHRSKSYDASMLQFASGKYGIQTIDLRLGIVAGAMTEEIRRDRRLATRFDFDFYFGVLYNRFCAQAVVGYPLTVYGKGGQTRGYISLEDTVREIVSAVELDTDQLKDYLPINIFTKCYSVKEVAEYVSGFAGVDIQFIDNPRMEKEEHYYNPANYRMENLLEKPRDSMKKTVRETLGVLQEYKTRISDHKDAFMVVE